jgi:hypothetical protein
MPPTRRARICAHCSQLSSLPESKESPVAEDQRTVEMQATTLGWNQAAQARWNDKVAWSAPFLRRVMPRQHTYLLRIKFWMTDDPPTTNKSLPLDKSDHRFVLSRGSLPPQFLKLVGKRTCCSRLAKDNTAVDNLRVVKKLIAMALMFSGIALRRLTDQLQKSARLKPRTVGAGAGLCRPDHCPVDPPTWSI